MPSTAWPPCPPNRPERAKGYGLLRLWAEIAWLLLFILAFFVIDILVAVNVAGLLYWLRGPI